LPASDAPENPSKPGNAKEEGTVTLDDAAEGSVTDRLDITEHANHTQKNWYVLYIYVTVDVLLDGRDEQQYSDCHIISHIYIYIRLVSRPGNPVRDELKMAGNLRPVPVPSFPGTSRHET